CHPIAGAFHGNERLGTQGSVVEKPLQFLIGNWPAFLPVLNVSPHAHILGSQGAVQQGHANWASGIVPRARDLRRAERSAATLLSLVSPQLLDALELALDAGSNRWHQANKLIVDVNGGIPLLAFFGQPSAG